MSAEPIERVWRLDELAAHAAHALSVMELAQSSGRVREVPDRRTIRYYTTLGLLSKPTGFQGRAALYGWEHLVQLVAIKRFQMKGLSLSKIQEELVGLPAAEVEELAAIPASLREELCEGGTREEKPAAKQEMREQRSFWTRIPSAHEGRSNDPEAEDMSEVRSVRRSAISVLQGVSLAEGLKLLLESPGRALEEDDVEAIRVAAGPLLKVLRARHILPAQDKGDER